MDCSEWFDNTVSSKRLATTLDSGRKPISTFTANLSSLSCRLQQFKGIEPVSGGRQISTIKYILYCGATEAITMSDLITYKAVNYEIVEQYFEENENSYMKLLLAKSDR